MLFAVGSLNPVKVACVAESVVKFWPAARAVGVAVASGVAAQPTTEREILAGAHNRASQALKGSRAASHGVGIEGGTLDSEDGMWAFAWVVAIDRQGRVGKGRTGAFLVPEGVARLVRTGLELGDADDRFFGRSNSKQQEGAIGILSDGAVTRTELYKQGVVFALLPWVKPEYYG